MKKLILLALVTLAVSLTGCTKNERARSFGGTTSVDVPKGQKVICATWKETDLWYLYRPMREGEQPETLILQESSTYGLMEGKVIFKESK